MLSAKPYLKAIELKPGEYDQNSYPFSIPAVKTFEYMSFHPDITFLIGENGSGKSTFLEAIAEVFGFGAQGGTGNFSMKDAGGQSGFDACIRVKRSYQRPSDKYFLRAESFYNVATFMDDLAEESEREGWMSKEQVLSRYGGKSLHHRSHGESFMSALQTGFGGKGLYILDEPEAALSPSRQLLAMQRINQLIAKDSQFIIATHSPIFLAYPGALIYQLDEYGIKEVTYEETEHYKVTSNFLANYKSKLANLFSTQPLLDWLESQNKE